MREHFRGLTEWKSEGLPVTTSSNEAAKLYDAALTQYVGWYAIDSLGGLQGTLISMLKADNEFVLGLCLKLGIDFIASERSIKTDSSFKDDLRRLEELSTKNTNLTKRELKHVDALIKYSNGDHEKATLIWESILLDHPTDTHVLKILQDVYFIYGRKTEMKDCTATVMPYYSSNTNPLTGYVYGMRSFALEENGLYDLSMKEANTALEILPHDGWAHHAIGHCYEMLGETKSGIQHYITRQKEWTKANGLLSHNWWHLGVYHIERNDFEGASKIFEENCLPICVNDGNIFNIVDSASFLYRLKLIDEENENSRANLWSKIYPCTEKHLNDHVLGFNEVHFMMSLLGSKRFDQAEQLINSLDKDDPIYPITSTILDAMLAHSRENHEKAVELLLPIKYKIVSIGGSDAQRSVLNQLPCMSAIKSPNPDHKKLAKHLLIERDQLKGESPLSNLMRQKLSI